MLATLLLGASWTRAENWPAWRGPTRDGLSADADLPTRWSRTENVRWRAALPEAGNSTPVVWGDRVFVTQNIGQQRSLLCFDRGRGKRLWTSGVAVTQPERRWSESPYCAPSPVTDGERVICWFGSAGVIAGDMQSAELAVRLGGQADVTRSHRLWRQFPARPRVGTGVIHQGHLYGIRANGIMDCIVIETGRFGVFAPGFLRGELFDAAGKKLASLDLNLATTPNAPVLLGAKQSAPAETHAVALTLHDPASRPLGELARAPLTPRGSGPK